MTDFRSVFFAALSALLITTADTYAQNAVGNIVAYPKVRFSANAVDPVIDYQLVHHMLADQDPQPLLRIYGNGRVHVHIPEYMKRSGDYELYLSTSELNALLRSLSQDGIIDFDRPGTKQKMRQLVFQQRASDGVLFHVSDITETVINITLDEYQAGPQAKPVVGLKQRFSWENLQQDAKRFRQLPALQGASSAAQRLHSLIDHPGLNRLP